MTPTLFRFRNFRLAAALSLSLGLGHIASALPSIQSIEVSPNPLTTGQNFTIAVVASPDVTKAAAVVAFRAGEPRLLQFPLVKQGQLWTGSGIVPSDLRLELPGQAGALLKVLVFDANRQRAEGVLNVGVKIESISAVFAAGILTITGDEQDNTIVASRDAAGTIVVNGGAVPVTGGAPTTNNTSLIRIVALGGNDVVRVDDSNGSMPPSNLLGGDGNDTLTGSANIDELDGGPGNDVLSGGAANDILSGGPDNDLLIGGRGTDAHFGGEGDDQFVWDPGDGSDLIEGEDGVDTMLFNGSNGAERIDLSPNGPRLRFFRDVGDITMDCDGVERVIFRAFGEVDQVAVNDLAGTQVSNVVVDLSNALGLGDGQKDTITVNGTGTNDVITISGSTNGVEVFGLHATVTVVGAEPGLDQLIIHALDGADVVNASSVQAGTISLTLDGGTGNDALTGGDGNDLLNGAQGNDVLAGGPGDDTFPWNPGDGSDVLEGQAGQDAMIFNGANIGESVDISANGQRLVFFRNVGSITMDCNELEIVQFSARGGVDTITVNDLSGTSVTNVSLNLENVPGSGAGDNEADTVIIMGTPGNDATTIGGTPAGISILGLSAAVSVVGSEPLLDPLLIRLLSGNDVLEASGLQAGVIKLTADGGLGDDVLVGSAGADVLLGAEGDDVLQGGPGLDVLDGGPGDNILLQD